MTNPFVEEIDFNEICLENEVVARGSYGTVMRGWWRNLQVAVKIIQTEQEKQAFFVEVKQLSRVNHPNIVKLYGACTKVPVCLVMEYAEGGSLYNVLHCMKDIVYTAAHVISWALQCATGVAYLHNMKPRALIHRDLKPPNLLLVNGGTVLKICDFGTACDCHTFMTNSRGSAAWMAPEVFEGSVYSEKCDIFSWAIILWEMLTREKPYYDVDGATAFGILWAIHSGRRPPLIKGCPKPIENLLVRCWSKDPKERYSMLEIIAQLKKIFKYFKGADTPILYTREYAGADYPDLCYVTPNETQTSGYHTRTSGFQTVERNNNIKGENTLNAQDEMSPNTSNEMDAVKVPVDNKKRHSADFSGTDIKLPAHLGHRRTGSYDSPCNKVQNPMAASDNSPLYATTARCRNDVQESFSNDYDALDPQLQPLQPVQRCPESVELYEEHCRMAQEFLQLQVDIQLLRDKRNKLQKDLQEQSDTSTYIEEYFQLKKENESLLQLRENLNCQLEIIANRTNPNGRNNRECENGKKMADDWVVV